MASQRRYLCTRGRPNAEKTNIKTFTQVDTIEREMILRNKNLKPIGGDATLHTGNHVINANERNKQTSTSQLRTRTHNRNDCVTPHSLVQLVSAQTSTSTTSDNSSVHVQIHHANDPNSRRCSSDGVRERQALTHSKPSKCNSKTSEVHVSAARSAAKTNTNHLRNGNCAMNEGVNGKAGECIDMKKENSVQSCVKLNRKSLTASGANKESIDAKSVKFSEMNQIMEISTIDLDRLNTMMRKSATACAHDNQLNIRNV